MNVLFLSSRNYADSSSYTNRALLLKEGVQSCGARTNILYLRDSLRWLPNMMQPLKTAMLTKLIMSHDIVSAEGLIASYAMCIAAKLARATTKIVHDVHGNVTAEDYMLRKGKLDIQGNLNLVQSQIMESLAIRRQDYFATCSEAQKLFYARKGVDEERIAVIRNGVDTTLFKPSNSNSQNTTFTATYAGAFQKWQGIDNFTRAAELLAKSNVNFRIIGFTNRDLSLKLEIRKRLRGKVDLVDKLPQAELIQQLCRSDIMVIPRPRCNATEVAFPTKFAEFIAIGKPVIVTEVDETSEYVINYDCGLVCDPTPESLAGAIIEASNLPRIELLQKGNNGRKLAENEFDKHVIGKQYFQFLSRITSTQ